MENEAACIVEQAKCYACGFSTRSHEGWDELCLAFTCEGEMTALLEKRKMTQ